MWPRERRRDRHYRVDAGELADLHIRKNIDNRDVRHLPGPRLEGQEPVFRESKHEHRAETLAGPMNHCRAAIRADPHVKRGADLGDDESSEEIGMVRPGVPA